MKQTLQFLRSAVPSKKPTTAQLELGELSMNTYDGKLFMKKSGSTGESVVSFVSYEELTGSLFSGSVSITGSFVVNGTSIFSGSVTSTTGFSGSLLGTASYALSSNNTLSSSFSSLALTASFVTTAQTASYVLNSQSASFAWTASFATTAQTASYVLNAQTASFVNTAQTASFVQNSISASFATTASFVTTAQTASYVLNAITASFITTAQTASYVINAQTASYVLQAVSASFATTASYYNTTINNIVNVGLTGSNVAFNSIKAAVDSIANASEYNTYTVRVYPGVYIEDTITMKSWVTVKGDSTTTTIVSGSNPSASVFIGADQSMIIDMQIQGATAPSASAVVYSSPTTPQTNAIFYVENVRFGTNYTHAKVIGTSGGNCIMQCSNVKYGGYPFTLGFHVTNDGSGIGRMQLRNVTSTNGGVTTTTGLIFAKADKPGCAFIVNGALLTKAVGSAAGTGFWVENGGSLRLTAVNFQRWDTAIYAPNTGSAPSIYGTALNFENNTRDVNILHTSATGKIEGTDNFLKVNLSGSIPLYEVGKDPRVLSVAKKGGDFTSISSSVAWITDSDANNRYVIQVGPGQYTEKTIDLTGKPYVSIVGSNIQTTQIFPSSSAQDIIKIGINNEISFLTLANAGSGYAAILVDDVGDFAQAHKISIYDSDIGVKVISSTQDTQFYGEYIDINGAFSYGAYVSSSNGAASIVNLENYYLYPIGGATTGNYVTNPSSSLSINTSTFLGDETPDSVAIKLEDGAVLEGSGVDIQGWDYGVRIPNVGIGPNFRLVGTMIHNSTTYDFDVLNDQTRGRFQGVSNHAKINNTSNNFYWNFLDDEDGENDVTRKLSVTFDDNTHTDASTLIFKGSAMGVMDGGIISEVSGTTINVSNGFGYVEKASSPNIIARLDWDNTQITLSPNTANYIYFTDAMVLSASINKPDSNQNIILGRAITNDSSVEFIDNSPHNATHTANLLSNFNREALGPVYANGSTVTENVTPKKLNISAGSYYFSENNFTPSGTSSIDLHQYFRSGSGWSRTTSSLVPTDLYDSGSGVVLVPLSASAYTKHTLYGVGDGADEKYFLVIGQSQYSALVDAESAALPTPPPYFSRGVVPIASIYVQSGSANITQIEDIRPVIGFKATGVNASSTHANLLGLGSDDHHQYLLVNGGREMTGNLGLSGNDLYNVDQIIASVVSANSFTGSLQGTASYSSNALTSSFASYSPTSSYADNFTVAGTITAQKLVVQTISSSVQYSSGSNIFGNTSANTHQFTGSVLVSGSIVVNESITGSLFGTASAAVSSSYGLSSSYALSSSQATNAITASFVTTAQTASFITTAQTASYVVTAQTASFVTTAQTASFIVSASNAVSSSYSLSSSFSSLADTASFVTTAQTASFIVSASNALSSSYALSSSNSILAVTASYVLTAQTASFVTTAQTASFIVSASNALSSSYAVTSSYALNGGVTSIIAGTNVNISPSDGLGAVTINATAGAASSFPYTGSAIVSGSLDVTGSLNAPSITGSLEGTSSYATTASYALNAGGATPATYTLSSGAQTISTTATGSNFSAFYNYTLISGSNARAGQFIAVWNTGSIVYTDTSTTDIGNTSLVQFTASLSGANYLLTTVLPTDGWTLKTILNLI